MRKYLTTALALVVLAGLYFYVMRFDKKPEEKPTSTASVTLAALEHDALASIEIQTKAYTVTLKATGAKEGSQWELAGVQAPPGRHLDAAKVDGLTYDLAPVVVRKKVAEGGDLVQFGLDQPAVRLAVTPKAGAPVRLAIGNKNEVSGGYYVQKAGDPAIYLWETQLPESLPDHPDGFFTEPPKSGG